MKNEDQEREFRLKPPKARRNQGDEARVWSVAFKRIIHAAHMSSSKASKRSGPPKPFNQRCAVRVTYSPNKLAGQWKAHGRYIERESATQENTLGRGFGPRGDGIEISTTLNEWQAAADPRVFKLIISPEFGDRLNLKTFTRDLMSEMQRDLGTRLEWVAAEHHNTEYPHVHVALRGLDEKGRPFRLERPYIQHGIRKNAEDLATARMGYRTRHDAEEAKRREVHQKRYTSLDRILASSNPPAPEGTSPISVDLQKHLAKTERCLLQARLLVLQKMGLAEPERANRWLVRPDFGTILRAMQRTDDRQRSLVAHAALVSDPRLPSRVTDLHDFQQLEGRVLGHGEEESSGRTYMILEGTDHNVHFIYRPAEVDVARQQGKLNPNAFVRLTTHRGQQGFETKVQYFGNSDDLLSDKHYFNTALQSLLKRGIVPVETGIAGWLGKYEARLVQSLRELQTERARTEMGRGR